MGINAKEDALQDLKAVLNGTAGKISTTAGGCASAIGDQLSKIYEDNAALRLQVTRGKNPPNNDNNSSNKPRF